MLVIVDLLLEGVFLILSKFFKELFMFELYEEFYDVIMVEDFDEEEDEGEGNELVNESLVCFGFCYFFFWC